MPTSLSGARGSSMFVAQPMEVELTSILLEHTKLMRLVKIFGKFQSMTFFLMFEHGLRKSRQKAKIPKKSSDGPLLCLAIAWAPGDQLT